MFLRTTRVKRPDGRVDEYIRLVESYWNQGRPRHRIVCNLGRKDVLPPHAEALLGLLQGQPPRGAALGAGRGGLGLGAFAGGAVLVEGVGPGGHPGPHRSRSPAVGSDLGPGGQSPDSADQRARLGALVGNGLCLRSARPTRAPPVAGRSRTAGQPSAAPYLDPPGSRGLGIFPSPRERSREGSFPPPRLHLWVRSLALFVGFPLGSPGSTAHPVYPNSKMPPFLAGSPGSDSIGP